MGETRQLLAIMFTDVVGYTVLTERDEAAAVRAREQHRDLVRTLVKQFDGEVIDATGDESLATFASALRAVDCALALQGALRSYPELRVRVGIHLGDVLRRNGEVVGEGVNVAARVRPLADPGGIVVSQPVWELVRSRPHLSARSLGRQSFKNVAEPVAVYALTASDAASAPTVRPRRRTWLAAVLGVLALVAALTYANRAAILAWIAIQAPRIFANPVEQQIGFAETSDGVRIAYATTGAGPPMIFVLGWATHLTEGLGSPLYDRGGAIAWHSRAHTVVRYDGRGFGLSDRNVSDFSLEARLRDLQAVVDALGLERFALYAFSAGGPTAVAYASRHPDTVSHLVLAATFLGNLDVRSETTPLTSEMVDLFRSSWDNPLVRATAVEWIAPEVSDAERRVMMHFLRVTGDGAAVAGFLGTQIDVSDEARRIRVPTLVVAGDEDRPVPLAASRQLASTIPGARFEILGGASHVEASISDPRLMRMVSEFLAQRGAN